MKKSVREDNFYAWVWVLQKSSVETAQKRAENPIYSDSQPNKSLGVTCSTSHNVRSVAMDGSTAPLSYLV